ncbi:hypothetical protein B0H17DRAFT_1217954 [Mycena rosella]|uniref:Uncharacterized protein n=1 Tax=Mycena rosella TaxID=1033263 RepID=A0AAD7FNJ9_MYCRO|nr:hypothetical protein B0H17DRAFT_1217954 [Mycena rosella]
MSILPTGAIYGHYCRDHEHLYTVHHGSAQTVLKTPLPREAPPIKSGYERVPCFHELRYISLEFPYPRPPASDPPIKARLPGPLPPISLDLQPPPPSRVAPPASATSMTTVYAALMALLPTLGLVLLVASVRRLLQIPRGATTTAAAMLALALVAIAAPLIAKLLVVEYLFLLVDHLFLAPPLSTLQWCEYNGTALGLRAIYRCAPPLLKQINVLPPLSRIAALAGFPSRFAREGPGFVYVLGLTDNWNLGDWHAHWIGNKEFLDNCRIKIGVAVDVPKRQARYRKCDVLQSHFWLWSFCMRNRMVAERLCQTFLDLENNNCTDFDCPSPHCDTHHQEFWWLKKYGGFLNVRERVRAALALLDKREERHDLQHAWLASY